MNDGIVLHDFGCTGGPVRPPFGMMSSVCIMYGVPVFADNTFWSKKKDAS